ncbi:hypothetical protein [Lysinibacillus sp. Y5S-8]|uniref:hypothetical protein n=1 Tax=Lysinibacillus sp. Y5S-8 TaxID=3122488 RepID=UPI0030CEBD72
MFITLILNFSEYHTFTDFDENKNFSLLENDFIPRVNDYVYDTGFRKDFKVSKVVWDYKHNKCNVYLSRSNIGSFEEIKIQAIDAGWKATQGHI